MPETARKYYSGKEYNIGMYAQYIYNVRQKLGLTMLEMANLLGINVSTYKKNESGAIRRIPQHIIDAYVNKLHVDPQRLLVPIKSDEMSADIITWANSSKAVPYILEAYEKYCKDCQEQENKKRSELISKIQSYNGNY